MIKNKDRSGWFGASDTNMIMRSWDTKTFYKWWLEKLGVLKNNFTNQSMLAGTHYEHRILDFLQVPVKDGQIKIRKYRLRINLDGNSDDTLYEVKTHLNDFKLSLAYKQQVQIQMFATGFRRAYIVSYQLTDNDYKNFFNDIDYKRLKLHKIEYDAEFIKEYLVRIKKLKRFLVKKLTPV